MNNAYERRMCALYRLEVTEILRKAAEQHRDLAVDEVLRAEEFIGRIDALRQNVAALRAMEQL